MSAPRMVTRALLASFLTVALVLVSRMASAWRKGVAIAGPGSDNSTSDRTVPVADGVYRVVSVPLQVGDAVIGSLELGTALDHG